MCAALRYMFSVSRDQIIQQQGTSPRRSESLLSPTEVSKHMKFDAPLNKNLKGQRRSDA